MTGKGAVGKDGEKLKAGRKNQERERERESRCGMREGERGEGRMMLMMEDEKEWRLKAAGAFCSLTVGLTSLGDSLAGIDWASSSLEAGNDSCSPQALNARRSMLDHRSHSKSPEFGALMARFCALAAVRCANPTNG